MPYDQSPHFTIVVGFCGKNRMVIMLIKIGPEYCAPHPYTAQCLQKDWVVVIAQSPNGWVARKLKVAFLKLQAAPPGATSTSSTSSTPSADLS